MTEAASATLTEAADSAIVDAATMLTALAALATLTEQNVGLQRQIVHLDQALKDSEARSRGLVLESEQQALLLTEAKFVTFRTLLDSNSEQVRIALDATKTAIDKAERATEKAIEKAEAANDKRFESVNEFRAQLTDLIARFATLERVDLLYNQTNQRFEEYKSNTDARLLDMSTRMTAMESAARGAQGSKTGLYAALAGIATFLGIVVIFANFLSK